MVAFGLSLRGFIYDDVIFDYQKRFLRHVIIYAVYGMGRNWKDCVALKDINNIRFLSMVRLLMLRFRNSGPGSPGLLSFIWTLENWTRVLQDDEQPSDDHTSINAIRKHPLHPMRFDKEQSITSWSIFVRFEGILNQDKTSRDNTRL